MTVDEERFQQLMQEQRERARNARKNAGAGRLGWAKTTSWRMCRRRSSWAMSNPRPRRRCWQF